MPLKYKLPHQQACLLGLDLDSTAVQVMDHLKHKHRTTSGFKLRVIRDRGSVYLRKGKTLLESGVRDDETICVLFCEAASKRAERRRRHDLVKKTIRSEVRRTILGQHQPAELLEAICRTLAGAPQNE